MSRLTVFRSKPPLQTQPQFMQTQSQTFINTEPPSPPVIPPYPVHTSPDPTWTFHLASAFSILSFSPKASSGRCGSHVRGVLGIPGHVLLAGLPVEVKERRDFSDDSQVKPSGSHPMTSRPGRRQAGPKGLFRDVGGADAKANSNSPPACRGSAHTKNKQAPRCIGHIL